MDARSAVEPGTADKRISSTSSREREMRRRRTVLGNDAAQVHDPLDPGARRPPRAKLSAIRRSRPAKSPFAPASIEWTR